MKYIKLKAVLITVAILGVPYTVLQIGTRYPQVVLPVLAGIAIFAIAYAIYMVVLSHLEDTGNKE